MKKLAQLIVLAFMLAALLPLAILAQDEGLNVTMRTLSVDWYSSSGIGVKVKYRGYDNEVHFLYLPKSFEKKLYRFVRAPQGVADHGLPVLIVRLTDQEVIFVDIYTKHLRGAGRIAEFDDEDMANFKAAEDSGKVEMAF
jgi:hypothetical protein